ncbi:hypothetical protein SEVIR_3G010500v4 [Setaria viridis]|uniref:GIR1-like zinc ribbon domain-containing protein n=2 Tax=Setaria TaxID=4554 RepID=K3ZDW2_SETIT|nr:hypothetical protein SETIT_3G009300v2 [Setaria italica]TKW23798.1 hypothetical protein SEVIR_3G010500v2 [Setaria viridis]
MSSEQGKRSTMAGAVADSSSPASSCVSSDAEEEVVQAAKPMVVVGCPQCLMYVMLSGEEKQPKCPRCKSPVLLHFLRADDASSNTRRR